MSIEKDYDIYIAVCDIGPFEDFYDAVDAKKAAGWRSRKDAHGEWIDLCPACQHPSAASDLEVSYEKSRDIGCCKGLCLR